MSTFDGIRFANTFLDIKKQNMAVPDEMLIDKESGRLFYKNATGTIIDLFEAFSVNIDNPELQSAFNEILRQAKEYADSVGSSSPGGGSASLRLVHYEYKIKIQAGQKIINIPLSTFNKETDMLLFTTNTVMPDEGYTIEDSTIVFDEALDEGTLVRLIIMKNVPVQSEEGFIDGNLIKPGVITLDMLHPDLIKYLGNIKPDEPLPEPPAGEKQLKGKSVMSSEIPTVEQQSGEMWFNLEEEVNPLLENTTNNGYIVSDTQPDVEEKKIWIEATN